LTDGRADGGTVRIDKCAARQGKMSGMALVVVCLVASAAILWILLPAGDDATASAVGGELPRSGPHAERTADVADDRSLVSPNGTASAAAGGGAEARAMHSEAVDGWLRSLAKNWADGTITDAEYIRAVSYLYEKGHITGGGSPRTYAEPEPVAEGGARGIGLGPAGSKQMWCKPGLAVAMDIHTGDFACLPAAADANRLADGGRENSPGAAGDANAGDRIAELEREVAKLEQIGAELRRTIEYLYGEVLSYRDAAGKSGTGMAVRQAASDVASRACLHGTSAFFAALLDPQVLAETSGALGATMMPGGEYTVLLAAAASSGPVTVSIDLEGEKGMSYAGRFALDDTGWPPGEDATLWDYNSGRAEFAVPVQQAVNMTVGLEGDVGGRAYMALAMCR